MDLTEGKVPHSQGEVAPLQGRAWAWAWWSHREKQLHPSPPGEAPLSVAPGRKLGSSALVFSQALERMATEPHLPVDLWGDDSGIASQGT